MVWRNSSRHGTLDLRTARHEDGGGLISLDLKDGGAVEVKPHGVEELEDGSVGRGLREDERGKRTETTDLHSVSHSQAVGVWEGEGCLRLFISLLDSSQP